MFKKVFIVVLDIIVYNKEDKAERNGSFNLLFMNQPDMPAYPFDSLVYKNAEAEEVLDESIDKKNRDLICGFYCGNRSLFCVEPEKYGKKRYYGVYLHG
ncbi:hypothetical protein LBYZC6_05410 [Lacrimispora brassicae]